MHTENTEKKEKVNMSLVKLISAASTYLGALDTLGCAQFIFNYTTIPFKF